MWCLNKKAIMTDEDPVVGQKRNPSKAKKFLKRIGNKVKKWVKKPKEALPNPNNNNNNNTEPLYGRRPEIALDLTHPFPIYNAMNNIQSSSSSNNIQPSDPKKTILFSTSSSKFMRIEEVSHVPHEGKMELKVGKEGLDQMVGRRFGSQSLGGRDVVRAYEMEKVKETVPNEYFEKGKRIEYYDKFIGSSLSMGNKAIQDGTLSSERGKGVIQYDSESDMEENADIKMIEEIPIEGFSLEANEAVKEIPIKIEEIPMEGISLEANQSIGTSMSQLIPFRPFCLGFYVFKYRLSLVRACIPPYFLGELVAGWSELLGVLQTTEEFQIRKYVAALEGLIRDTFYDSAPQMTHRTVQNLQLLIAALLKDSTAVQSSVQIEEIPPVSQEANKTGVETPSEEAIQIEANPRLLFRAPCLYQCSHIDKEIRREILNVQ